MDRGFTLVKNQTTFNLRANSDTYSIKFYSAEPHCNSELGTKLVDRVCHDLQNLKGAVSIDQVAPHQIQLLVRYKFQNDEILELASLLNSLT